MTRVTLVCMTCGYQARRDLSFVPGCRGVHETPNEAALCPKGHGPLLRKGEKCHCGCGLEPCYLVDGIDINGTRYVEGACLNATLYLADTARSVGTAFKAIPIGQYVGTFRPIEVKAT